MCLTSPDGYRGVLLNLPVSCKVHQVLVKYQCLVSGLACCTMKFGASERSCAPSGCSFPLAGLQWALHLSPYCSGCHFAAYSRVLLNQVDHDWCWKGQCRYGIQALTQWERSYQRGDCDQWLVELSELVQHRLQEHAQDSGRRPFLAQSWQKVKRVRDQAVI